MSKIVKNSEEKKMSKNLKKNHFFSKNLNFLREKNCLPKKSQFLSFPILGVRDSTRALQSSPLQNPGEGGPLSLTEQDGARILKPQASK